jgi:hypothetical protein
LRNGEPNFASYRLYRDRRPDVTTSDRLVTTVTNNAPSAFLRRDTGLAPGTYFYKVFVFDRDGRSSGSNEVAGRIFAPDEVVSVIAGVPEPGDTNFPPQVVIPNSVSDQTQFDCTQYNPLDPMSGCDGTFIPIGRRIDCFGHVRKFRTFPNVTIQNSILNGIPNARYIVHLGDIVRITLFAQDDHYTFTQPDFGLFSSIPQGAQRFVEFSPGDAGVFRLRLRDSGGSETTAGTLTVLP